ncbi:cell wall-binding repeat-containing protein [Sediminibacillus albus]|uniref:cell wall-binding repeat-containing protein n=1 Tax=Sediminibacillus albus TaxID=407036 RepID=UPI003CCBE75D
MIRSKPCLMYFFAKGFGIADALSGVSLAAKQQPPLLLINHSEVPGTVSIDLGPALSAQVILFRWK